MSKPFPSKSSPEVVVRSACLVLVAVLTVGCGYHWSNNNNSFAPDPNYPWSALYRQDVRTVAVPIFANRTYYRGLEINLTKSIITQLEGRTPYKVAPKEQADTILEGEIVNVGINTISRSPANALPQEQNFYIVVNFTWKDLRTGKILTQRHSFQQVAPYYPTLGEDTFVGAQENIERLGLAIVEELQADWGNTKAATSAPATPNSP